MEVGMPRTIRRLMRKYGLKGSNPGRPIPPSRMDIRRPHQPNVGLPRELLRDEHQTRIIDEQFRHWLNDPAARASIERDAVPIPAR